MGFFRRKLRERRALDRASADFKILEPGEDAPLVISVEVEDEDGKKGLVRLPIEGAKYISGTGILRREPSKFQMRLDEMGYKKIPRWVRRVLGDRGPDYMEVHEDTFFSFQRTPDSIEFNGYDIEKISPKKNK